MIRNIFQLGVCFITMIFITAGCSKDNEADKPEVEPPTPIEKTLTVSPLSVTFKPEGETQTISIYANTGWTIKGEDTEQWCQIDKTTGTGDASIILTAGKNPTEEERNYHYTVTSTEGKKAIIHLSQPGSDLRVIMLFNCQDDIFKPEQSVGLFTVNRPAGNNSSTILNGFTDNQINNAKITKQADNIWKSSESIYWKSSDIITDAYAYFPWRQSTSKDTPTTWYININEDQSSLANSNASIFLYGQKLGQLPGENGVLEMTFAPLVAQVIFHIKIADDAKSVYELTDISMINIKNEATLDLNTGIVTPGGSSNKIKGYMVSNTDGSYDVKFYTIPQTIQDTYGTITYFDKRYNETITGDIPLESSLTLEAGKSYSAYITLLKTFDKLEIDNITISDWEKGEEFNFSFN